MLKKTNRVYLPQEIIFNILSRLSLLDLSRCRFVRKDWNNFIKNPYFVELHNSCIKQDGHKFVIFYNTHTKLPKFYLADTKNQSNSLKTTEVKFSWPTQNEIEVVGSSYGLICLGSLPKRDKFCIGNPITREMEELPDAPCVGKYAIISVGFGFDLATKTYKIIRTCEESLFLVPKPHSLQIYTIGTKEWRMIDYSLNCLFNGGIIQMLFLNGAIHSFIYFIENEKLIKCIGVIDIEVERVSIFKEPSRGNVFNRHMRSLAGHLCLIDEVCDQEHIVVWIMKTYGVEESWTREYNIRQDIIGSLQTASSFTTFQEIENGIVLLNGGGGKELSYYDLKHEMLKAVQIKGVPSRWKNLGILIHAGSLVSPKCVSGKCERNEASPS